MSDFFFVRDKTTGAVRRLAAKPWLGNGSNYELVPEEEGVALFAPKAGKAPAVAPAPKPEPVVAAPEPVIDDGEFSGGLTDGDEDGG